MREGSGQRDDLAEVMSDVARHLDQQGTVEEQLQRVLEAAVDTVPGVDVASITVLHRDGRAETVAHTDDLACKIDHIQYQLDEGPCLDALRGQPFQRVDDMPAEQRWPRYTPLAVQEGVGGQLGLELYHDARSIGGLNLYATSSNAFDEETRYAAWLFATHAALAMGRTREAEQLNEALSSRKVIGQALGIVMERFGLDEDRAFQFLVRVSRNSNIKLRDVAARIVSERSTEARPGG
jgi:transcriptional regulator with GAF, ATPase, and Fis domain